jgi:hypothetical protein
MARQMLAFLSKSVDVLGESRRSDAPGNRGEDALAATRRISRGG